MRKTAASIDESPWLLMVDIGCRAGGPSCLACRLPACVHDGSGWFRREQREERMAEIRRLVHLGLGYAEVARIQGVSRRTVYRATGAGT